ncbi:hypothetical protein EDF21_1968 [Frigoribacterium sp. PhB118]|nr:hypothetical protein EDF21_1968 [Frigoribacterium sp. PhB118]
MHRASCGGGRRHDDPVWGWGAEEARGASVAQRASSGREAVGQPFTLEPTSVEMK